MKLSAKQRAFLKHCQENSGTVSMWPIGLCTHRIVNRCCNLGFVEKIRPESGVGAIKFSLTPAGRALLEGE